MKSLFQNICRRWPREGGREGEPLCRKHFTSCSSCLLLKPGASGLGQGVLATPPRSGQGSRASARLGPSGGGGPPVRARFPTHIPGSAATDRSGPSSCAPPGTGPGGGRRPRCQGKGRGGGANFPRPERAGRRPSLSSLRRRREAVSRGRCCPLLLLFLLSPSCKPHHSHLGQPGSRHGRKSPPSRRPHRPCQRRRRQGDAPVGVLPPPPRPGGRAACG